MSKTVKPYEVITAFKAHVDATVGTYRIKDLKAPTAIEPLGEELTTALFLAFMLENSELQFDGQFRYCHPGTTQAIIWLTNKLDPQWMLG